MFRCYVLHYNSASSLEEATFLFRPENNIIMNAFVHEITAFYMVMAQTRHKFPEWEKCLDWNLHNSESLETKFAHCSNELCIINCITYRTSNVSSFGCVTIP